MQRNLFYQLKILVALLLLISAFTKAMCDETPDGKTASLNVLDERVEHHLQQMEQHIAKLNGFSVQAELLTEIRSGDKVHRDRQSLTIKFRKPNRIFMSTGNLRLASRGDTLRFVVAGEKKYIERRTPSDLSFIHRDDCFKAVTGIMGKFLVPLLFTENLHESVLKGVQKTDYATANQENKKFHCLKFYTEEFDWELWIPDGIQEPHRLRMQLSDRRLASDQSQANKSVSPQTVLTLRFSNWVSNPPFKDHEFEIEKPRDGQAFKSFSELMMSRRPKGPDPLLRKQSPDFVLEATNGEKIQLSQHFNKNIVVLEFWTTWSRTSQRTLPILARTREKFRDMNVVFYSINVREGKDTIREYCDRTKLDLGVVVMDKDGKVAESYGISGIPQSFIIDIQGKIQDVFRGFSSDLESRVVSELKGLCGENGGDRKTVKPFLDASKSLDVTN